LEWFRDREKNDLKDVRAADFDGPDVQDGGKVSWPGVKGFA
jgi:hypothetical protein